MKEKGIKNPNASLQDYNITSCPNVYWNYRPDKLIKETLYKNQGTLTSNGTLAINTGKFTGRSPQDRFIVKDSITENKVDWNSINQPFDAEKFDQLQVKLTNYLNDKDLYIKDAAACHSPEHRLPVRLIAEFPWSAHFVHNMFLRLDDEQIKVHDPEWTILCAPGFHAEPEVDGTRASNFSIINFTKKIILVGGSGYTGEIKKGIFSVLNFNLPTEKKVLSMHCSANVSKDGDTAVFFGLSGTGKTTLSADPNRQLVGDDEHGWSDEGVFNFEGGCYAKCIGLSKDKEPDIYNAIKPGAILENIKFHEGTSRPNFDDTSITQNTRVSYPLHHISNLYKENVAPMPTNIFFLTCDAFGILPPLSKLSKEQAMYYFISGYTAKVAGTEEGVKEPQATFSACFGAPFLPLHPNEYAQLLGEKIDQHNVNIWLVNTGWTSGSYGEGHRISLKHTRQLISSVLDGKLDKVEYSKLDVFNLMMPVSCEGISEEILDPKKSWANPIAYDEKRIELAELFNANFDQFKDKVTADILAAAPKLEKALT